MWHSVDGMGWWMLWGAIMMVVFWGLIIALAVWFVRSLAPPDGGREERARPSPLDIARERYARGEISREQFEQIRRDVDTS